MGALHGTSNYGSVLIRAVLVTAFGLFLQYERCVSVFWKPLGDNTEIYFKGIDMFCMLADNNKALPPLLNGKKWVSYKLSSSGWKIIDLIQDCLKVWGSYNFEKFTVATFYW